MLTCPYQRSNCPMTPDASAGAAAAAPQSTPEVSLELQARLKTEEGQLILTLPPKTTNDPPPPRRTRRCRPSINTRSQLRVASPTQDRRWTATFATPPRNQ